MEKPLTKREREQIKAIYDASKVRLRDGERVEVYTSRSRGDGGKSPWWMFAGYINDVRQQLA